MGDTQAYEDDVTHDMTTLPTLPRPILRKLDELRRAVTLWFVVDGIGWLLVALVGWVFVSFVFDYGFQMDLAQRLIMLIILVAVLGAVVYRRWMLPMGHRLSADELAIRVERRHPELADGLVSALQLSRMEDPAATGASPQLIAAAIEQGARRAEPVSFDDVIDRPGLKRNLRRAGLAILALVLGAVGAVVFMPDGTLGLWAGRNLALSSQPWPRDTDLFVEHDLFRDGVLTMPRGDDLNLRVRAAREVPDIVYLDHRSPDARRKTDQMIAVGDDAFRFAFPNVLGGFEFRVRGGDAASDWYTVRLVDRPALMPDDAGANLRGLRISVDPPAYTGLTRQELAAGEGAYRVLHGSALVIEGLATKALASATLSMPGPVVKANDETNPQRSRRRSRAAVRVELPMSIEPVDEQRITRTRDDGEVVTEIYPAGPRRFAIAVPYDKYASGAFAISLVDTDGLATRRPIRFNVKVDADESPSVRATLAGIGDMITENAVIPIDVRVRDDFAVEDVALNFRFTMLAGDKDSGDEALPIDASAYGLGGAKLDPFTHEFAVEPLAIWQGSILTFDIAATDNDAVTGPKVGKSSAFSVKIVTEEELRNELLRREQEQRMEFERLVKDQRALEVDTRALKAGLAGDGKLTADQVKALGAVEKKQRLIAGRCEGIAQQFAQIVAEVFNNRIEERGGPIQVRLGRRIIDPLRYLAIDVVPVAADAVDIARRPALSHAERLEQMARAVETQQNAIQQMELILRNMVKLEGYQEAINLLREIIKSQQDINEQTIQALEERIEGIFDD